jgi:hypothetical protein
MEKQGREKTTEVIAESAYEFLSLGRGWFLKHLGCRDWKRFKFLSKCSVSWEPRVARMAEASGWFAARQCLNHGFDVGVSLGFFPSSGQAVSWIITSAASHVDAPQWSGWRARHVWSPDDFGYLSLTCSLFV